VGWGSAGILALFGTAVAALAAFVANERRVAAPVVEFAVFRSRSSLGANLVGFIVTFAMFGMFFFMALYMQNVLEFSPLQTGVRFLPSTLTIMVMAPVAGRLADRVGPRVPVTCGDRRAGARSHDAHRGRLCAVVALTGALVAWALIAHGSVTRTVVPAPGELVTTSVPPADSTRSSLEARPM
jgi:MFS family permease